MKARIKETGEIFFVNSNITKLCLDYSDGDNVAEVWMKDVDLLPDDYGVHQEQSPEVDWEQRRYEIAKELTKHAFAYPIGSMRESIKMAIEYADELIKQLKGE